jgi:hypothetical protein
MFLYARKSKSPVLKKGEEEGGALTLGSFARWIIFFFLAMSLLPMTTALSSPSSWRVSF